MIQSYNVTVFTVFLLCSVPSLIWITSYELLLWLQRHHKGFSHTNVDVKADSIVKVIIGKPEELDCDKRCSCSRKRGRWEGLLTDEKSRLEVETLTDWEGLHCCEESHVNRPPERESEWSQQRPQSAAWHSNTTVLLHLHAPPPSNTHTIHALLYIEYSPH